MLTLVLGAGLIAAGVVRLYLALQLPAEQPRLLVFVAGAVTILLGLIIVTLAREHVYVLGTLLGVDLLFMGSDGPVLAWGFMRGPDCFEVPREHIFGGNNDEMGLLLRRRERRG